MIEIPRMVPKDDGFPSAFPCWSPAESVTVKANLWCANGHVSILTEHQIEPDGTVNPSCVCPKKGCNFHAWVKLIGWPGR